MDPDKQNSPQIQPVSMRWPLLITIAVLVLGTLGFWASSNQNEDQHTHAGCDCDPISLEALETRYGIRIRLVAVTAAGGMVDFRYKVVDLKKAESLLHEGSLMPTLVVEKSGVKLVPPEGMSHDQGVIEGRLYYVLFPNIRNAVTPGTSLTVSLGDITVGPLVAK